MINTVKCPLCDKVITVPNEQTRSDVLIKHLRDTKHNGEAKTGSI